MYAVHGYAAISSLSGLRVWAWRRLEKASDLGREGWYGLPTPHGRTGPSQTNSRVMHSGCLQPEPPSTTLLRKTEVQRPAQRLLTFGLAGRTDWPDVAMPNAHPLRHFPLKFFQSLRQHRPVLPSTSMQRGADCLPRSQATAGLVSLDAFARSKDATPSRPAVHRFSHRGARRACSLAA